MGTRSTIRRAWLETPGRMLDEDSSTKMAALAASPQSLDCPGWLMRTICFVARLFIRTALRLTTVELRASLDGGRRGFRRVMAAASLSVVNVCAAAAGVAMGWLTRAVLFARRQDLRQRRYWRREQPRRATVVAPGVLAVRLHD